MSKLFRELQRLYFPGAVRPLASAGPGASGEPVARLDLIGSSGMTRALLVGLRKAADWDALARLYEALQQDLGFPAPAVSVAGDNGFWLWLSLAEPVPLARADAFLTALRERYLDALPAASLVLCPSEQRSIELPPAKCAASDRWSAFIDPSMGAMFAGQAGLDMTPSRDRQADLLAVLMSIKTDEFARALSILGQGAPIQPRVGSANEPADESCHIATGRFDDPRSFLLAVMNDASSPAHLRVDAAKALLPYFEKLR